MRQLIKRFSCAIFLACSLQVSWGFALLGPNGNGGDSWQTTVIGYDLAYESLGDVPGGPVFLGDIGGPKNIAEEYRRNAPVLYYAYNENFADFFGADGEAAADQAFAIMNSLTNVDNYSSSLSEFPFNSQHFNYQAQSLFLTDLKSVTLHLLVEQMGLAQPERFTWTLHERYLPPGGVCPPDELYTVVQRNYDTIPSSPTNQIYSSYVNNVLYTYLIVEDCTGPDPLAITEPFAVDPTAEQYTAVAANNYNVVLEDQNGELNTSGGGLQIGGYYTGLTRDDVNGLRYLLRTNNINYETAATNSQLLATNVGSSQIVVSNLNLSLLSANALTNDPVTLLTLFPNLLITSVTTNFAVVCTPNIVSYLTNYIGSPAGSPPVFVVTTNGSNCFYQPVYGYTFANVITNTYSTNSQVLLVTTSLGNQNGAPVGSPAVTNSVTNSIVLNVPSGSYYIIPAGDCGLNIVANSGITSGVTVTTNVLTTATNANGFVSSQSIVTIFTNRQYLAYPAVCGGVAGATGRYQGIKRVQFIRVPDLQVDPLTGNFLQPLTNTYTMVVLNPTNSQFFTQTFQRVVTRPDILMSANDQGFPSGAFRFNGTVTRNINFDQANVLPGLAGPGVINSPSTFSYNKIGLTIQNLSLSEVTNAFLNTFLSQFTGIPSLAWASFDGSTNAPEVYPNGTSIQNLENQLTIQVTPTTLADGFNNSVYTPVTFTATGGGFSAPFTWSATGLPAGLTISSDGTLSGTPTQSGTFDFTLQLTDSLAHSVQWTYSITIQ